MTINEFAALVQSVDADASRYQRIQQPGDSSYTVWREYAVRPLWADGYSIEQSVQIQVDYFTKSEGDEKAATFKKLFSENDEITLDYQIDFETDTRFIHHIYDLVVTIDGEV